MVTLGEGNTPLVWTEIEGVRVALKLEMANPSGSYKDRGTSVLMSHFLQRGVTEAVEDSSGNAGASFAAYAARAGIKGRVFVPESASGPKRVQIEQHGAELVSIPGPRSEAARAVLQEVEQGATYASHAYLPFGLAGIATIAYELWQQLGSCPGSVIAPVGHGGLLLGIMRGFSALQDAGLIPNVPHYVGVQAQACAPAVSLYLEQFGKYVPVQEDATVAEGVRVRHPVRAAAILNEMGLDGGEFIAVPEEKIMPAYHQAARQGFYIEPTSALPWAALNLLKEDLPEPVIIILTGTGLKYNPYS
jgi:threonine synthase